jgi:hypothetical protein
LKNITTGDVPFEQVLKKVPFRIAATADTSIDHGDEFFAYSGVSLHPVP